MANVIKHKRGSGSDPTASDLVVGEVAIRTDVGKLFTKMDNGSVAEIAGGGSDIIINTLSASSSGSGASSFNSSENRFQLSSPPSVSAQQLLVSVNGVIQKPVPGTGTPSEGFSVDGNDIIFSSAPETGADFFILTFKSLGVSEPADNSVTSAKIADGAIVNADINASAAIAGSKINPSFGNQNVVTSGNLTVNSGQVTINGSTAAINFTDNEDNPDYRLVNSNGIFKIRDATNTVDRLKVNTDGHVDVTGNLDVGAGIDVLGGGIVVTNGSVIANAGTNNQVRIGTDGAIEISRNSGGAFIDFKNDPNEDHDARIQENNGGFDISGNVNIASGLDVTGDITGTGDLILSSGQLRATDQIPAIFKHAVTGTTPCTVLIGNNTHNFAFAASSSGFSINDYTNTNQQRLFIDTSGNVGVGTNSPESKLSVDGSVAISSNATAVSPSGYDLKIRSDTSKLGIHTDSVSGTPILEFGTGGATGGFMYTSQAQPLRFGINASEKARIDSSGNVGIGTASPQSQLELSAADNTIMGIQLGRAGSAITASRYIGICQTGNPTNLSTNSGFSGVEFGGPSSSDEAYLAFHTHDAGVGSGERFRIDKTGNIVPADSLNVLSTLRTQGQTFVKLTGHSTSNFSVMVFGVNSGGHNTGSCAVALGKHSTNSRSLNAAGTVNASGNDYAEYMTKSSDFTLAKGDICGIDANGKLTNKFSESISFVVKSTDPSYVGGDAWGTEEVLGEKPADDSDDLPAYEEKYEAARKMVDRIAFSGQVPVNVTGTTPGQHIIPTAGSGDAITGVAKAEKDLSITEYMSSIGKVIGLESDGRAKIIVKVA